MQNVSLLGHVGGMCASQDFVSLVSEYIHGVANEETEPESVRSTAAKTWRALKRSAKAGPRRTVRLTCISPVGAALRSASDRSIAHIGTLQYVTMQLPSTEELEALFADRKLNTIVFFLDETFEELAFDVTTTVLEAVEALAGIIKLQVGVALVIRDGAFVAVPAMQASVVFRSPRCVKRSWNGSSLPLFRTTTRSPCSSAGATSCPRWRRR